MPHDRSDANRPRSWRAISAAVLLLFGGAVLSPARAAEKLDWQAEWTQAIAGAKKEGAVSLHAHRYSQGQGPGGGAARR